MKSIKLLTLALAVAIAPAVTHAQTITYNIGVSPCTYTGQWCEYVPLTLQGEQSSSVMIDIRYDAASKWVSFDGSIDPITSGTVVATTTYNVPTLTGGTTKQTVPTEYKFTFADSTNNLSGNIDLVLTCKVGKTGRYAYGVICSTSSGTVVITQ
jgi:hypothetical protein